MIQIKGLTKTFVSGERRVDVLSGIDLRSATASEWVWSALPAPVKRPLCIFSVPSTALPAARFCWRDDLFSLRGPALDAFRNRTVGFVFQFHQLLPEFSALENAMMPALIARQKPRDAAAKAEEFLREVGLGHRLSHKPGELSGGEQQRVAIARSLVMSPRLLLADEPTGNLDSRTSEDIYRLLEQLHRKHALTMVVVTHSEMLASRLDRIVHMEDGRLLP